MKLPWDGWSWDKSMLSLDELSDRLRLLRDGLSRDKLKLLGDKLKQAWGTKKGKLVISGVVVAVVALVALVCFLLRPKDGYRTIQIYEVDGEAEIDRPGVGVSIPYEDMMLQNEDRVTTLTDGWLYLIMDGSKYLLAEPRTKFNLEATGTKKDSRTRLDLKSGALVNHITEPLSSESSYEVSTPNSVMAVRGTSFRVSVWYDDEGVSHTKLEVFEGVVEVHLLYPNGTLSKEGRKFYAGQVVYIWGDENMSDYEGDIGDVDYYVLEIKTLEFLKIGIERGSGYLLTVPDVDEIIRLKQTYFPVRFTVDGELFGTQSVLFDHYATEPLLRPKAEGSWDFDFGTAIRQETEIPWKQ